MISRLLPILLVSFLISPFCFSQNCSPEHQWEKTNPGGGGWFGSVGASLNGVILAGSDLSGAYRSMDDGETWDVCGENKGFNETHVSGLGFHKSDPNIMFLAGGGIYKSSDEGDSWLKVLDTSIESGQRGYITDIEFGTNQSNVGYASYHGGNWNTLNAEIYKTTDNGDSWSQVTSNLPPTRIIKVIVSPLDANEVYLLTGKGRPVCAAADVYKSVDGGVTWNNLTATQSFEGFSEVVDVGIDPNNTNTLYITTANADCADPAYYTGLNSKLWKSINGGASWFKIQDQGGLIFVDPNDSQKVTIIETRAVAPWNNRSGTRVSVDGGINFTRTSTIDTWETAFHGIHQYTYGGTRDGYGRSVVQDYSDPDNFYWINSQWIAGSNDGGTTFQVLHGDEDDNGNWQSNGADNIVHFDMTISPQNPNVIYLGLADMGMWRSLDKGTSWESCNTESNQYGWGQGRGGNVHSILVDPERPDVVWIGIKKGYILRSDDKGAATSWAESNAGLISSATINGLSMDINSTVSNRTMYATSNGDVFKSTDDGASWSIALSGSHCVYTAVDQFNGNIVYAGGTQGLWRSTNQGTSWTRLTTLNDIPADNINIDVRSNFYKGIYDIQTDPNNANRVYVTVLGAGEDRGLFYSGDAGDTWTKLITDKYMRKVAIAPTNSDILYATSSSAMYSGRLKEGSNGIWFSDDQGQTWSLQNQEMAYPFASAVEITNEQDPIVFVGSPGTGFQKSIVPIPSIMANCQPLTVFLDEQGVATITPEQINNASSSSCPIDSMTLDISQFSCDDLGTNTVTLTVTDLNGNSSECETIVTVNDSFAPQVSGPDDISVNTLPSSDSCGMIVTYDPIQATDNCGTDDVIILQTSGLGNGALFPVGTTTESYEATDNAGNVTVFSFSITVSDATAPEFVNCPDVMIETVATGEAYTIPDYSLIIDLIDNCTTDPTFTQNPNPGVLVQGNATTSIMITGVDDNGNTSTCNFQLVVEETLSLQEALPLEELVIYPNPTQDIVHFNNRSSETLKSIEFFDLLGKRVKKVSKVRPNTPISLAELSSGLYLVKLSTDANWVIRKIIIK